ncbi:hypothetical protein DFH94DRAFT_674345 [Russula ochroleuca]|uniref:Cryptic loci regulator 2 N-terminal domain-containing protein n=1 Tax=Russula ochroleuca TaxID=152965 RepID=A0A9P5JZP3_9AGAM|nr:hypothetical protein DFH94DRAFT_674345 [Russula ochroleuca]
MATSTDSQENGQLTLGPDGWEGEGKYFGVRYNVIKIKNTDAETSHAPSAKQRLGTKDEDGIFSQHEQLEMKDPIYQLWMFKIGPYLADWVLGKHTYANPPWKLLKFPENYTLWIHKKGVETDPANPRIDAYLHGAPHLGPSSRFQSQQLAPTVFRSPTEFVEHAIWLMKGCVGQCLCKYCTPDQSQKEINLRLNHGDAVEDDEPESDGGGGGSGSGSGSGSGTGTATRNSTYASSSSTRRGASAGARAQRRAKRERSPPIMAKDYRVGNPGPAT